MSLKDDVRSKLRKPGAGGWKELIQGKSEVQPLIIEVVGEAIGRGAMKNSDSLVTALDLVMQKKQHINDLDLLLILEV